MVVIIIIVTFISIIFSLKLLQCISGSFKITDLNVISFMYYISLFPNVIGTTLILIGLAKNHYVARELVDRELNMLVWLICILLPIFLFIVMYVISDFFKLAKFSNYYKAAFVEKPRNPVLFTNILIILSILTSISAIYTFKVLGEIPLLKLVNASPYELSIARYKAKFEFGGNTYIRNFIGIELSIMLSYVSYIYGRVQKNHIIRFLWLYNSLLSVLLLTYDYEKAPLIFYFLGYVMIHFYLRTKIGFKYLLKSFGVIVFLTILISYFTFKYENFLYIFTINGPFGRMFIGQIIPLYFHFIYFPREHSFLYGMNYPKFIALLTNSEYIRSSKIVMNIFSDNEFAGHMNTVFIAEAYANWGWIGILLSIFVVGIVYGVLYTVFIKTRKTPVSIGIFIYIFIEMAKSINGGFYDFIYNPSLYFAFALLILLQYFYTFQTRKGN